MKGDKGISAFPDGDNIFKWIGTIHGPEETVSTFHKIVMPTFFVKNESNQLLLIFVTVL